MEINCIEYEFRKKDLIECIAPIPNFAFYNDYQRQEIIKFVEYKIRQK